MAGEPGRPPSVAYFHSSLPSVAFTAYRLLSYTPTYTTLLTTSGLPRISSSHLKTHTDVTSPVGAAAFAAPAAAAGAPAVAAGATPVGAAPINGLVKTPVLARRLVISASFMACGLGERSAGV